MEKEIWKDIEGYEGLYQISNLGRIRKYIILRQFLSHKGYLTTQLSKENKSKTFLVHRLVAKTFIPKIDGKNQINHKDGNKINNKVENLEWCTQKENINYSQKINSSYNDRNKEVQQFDKNNKLLATYKSISDASRITGIKVSSISYSANGQRKTGGGYIWRFV